MTKIVLSIGRLVVHGANGFAAEAFSESLRQEISRHLAQGAGAHEVAQRLQGNASSALHGTAAGQRTQRQAPAGGSAESSAAAEVAGRLFKEPRGSSSAPFATSGGPAHSGGPGGAAK